MKFFVIEIKIRIIFYFKNSKIYENPIIELKIWSTFIDQKYF
jgi:hypothetical protein